MSTLIKPTKHLASDLITSGYSTLIATTLINQMMTRQKTSALPAIMKAKIKLLKVTHLVVLEVEITTF